MSDGNGQAPPYSAAFQNKMVRTLYQEPQFATSVGIHLDPELFEGKSRRWLAGMLLGHAKKYGVGASMDAVRIAADRAFRVRRLQEKDRQDVEALITKLKIPVRDRSYVMEELFRFTKFMVFKDVVKKSLDHMEALDLDSIDKEFSRVLELNSANQGGLGHFYVRDVEGRTKKRQDFVPQGFSTGTRLDDYLKAGGLWRKALGVVLAGLGRGKCLKIGTMVLSYDGRLVKVEDVRVGDSLMGPDSLPRKVLSTTRGVGPLYRIIPVKGRSWVCNDQHVLSVRRSSSIDDHVVDISVEDWIASSKKFKGKYKQFGVGVDFPAQHEKLPIDPYFLGVWFGDGTKSLRTAAITKPDFEIAEIVKTVAASWGLRYVLRKKNNIGITHCVSGPSGGAGGTSRNPLLIAIRNLVGSDVIVPRQYLVSSREDRLAFLAGWLDTDGCLHYGNFEFLQKRKDWAFAVAFLARSLGFKVTIKKKWVQLPKSPRVCSYWRLKIIGDCSVIPTRLPRKKALPREINKSPTHTGFSVEPAGIGEFAGFDLGGDGRFLLGDFTVTHNSSCAVSLGRAAILNSSAKVLHVTVELPEEMICDKYDAAFSDVPLNDLESDRIEVESVVQGLGTRLGEFLVIKEFPSVTLTVPMLRSYMRQLQSVPFYPDVVIVDYADEMLSTVASSTDDITMTQGSVYRELRKMAQELNVAVWTCCQVNRSGLDREVIDERSTAGAIAKPMIADYFFAMCQTPQEFKSKIGRAYVIKSRGGPARFEVPVKMDWSRSVLSDRN